MTSCELLSVFQLCFSSSWGLSFSIHSLIFISLHLWHDWSDLAAAAACLHLKQLATIIYTPCALIYPPISSSFHYIHSSFALWFSYFFNLIFQSINLCYNHFCLLIPLIYWLFKLVNHVFCLFVCFLDLKRCFSCHSTFFLICIIIVIIIIF